MRRVVLVLGALLGVLGVVAAVGAVVQPWARYRASDASSDASSDQVATLSVLDFARGQWYLILLCVAFAAAIGAVAGRGRQAGLVALVGVLSGLAGTILAVTMADRLGSAAGERTLHTLLPIDIELTAGPAIGPAVAAPLLLAIAAALLAAARGGRARPAG